MPVTEQTPVPPARDIMRDLDRVGAADTIEAAAHKMADLDVDAVAVCGPESNLHTFTGMITERDITERVIAQGRDPATTRVGEIAQRDIGTIGADDPIQDAPEIMDKHRIGRLPVIEGFRVVGILEETDVARALPDPPTDGPGKAPPTS